MERSTEFGVIYCVDGPRKFFTEALRSAMSVRRQHPDIPIAIASATPYYLHDFFDHKIRLDPNSPFSNKVYGVSASPFENTLFLDSDTYVVAPIDALFGELPGHVMISYDYRIENARDPETFSYAISTMFNTGVFRIGPQSRDLLRKWAEHIESRDASRIDRGGGDQPSFNHLFAGDSGPANGVTVTAIDPLVFNVRSSVYRALPPEARARVRILHDHDFGPAIALRSAAEQADFETITAEAQALTDAVFARERAEELLAGTADNVARAPNIPGYYRQLDDLKSDVPRPVWLRAVREVVPRLTGATEVDGSSPNLKKLLAKYLSVTGDKPEAQRVIERALPEKAQDAGFWFDYLGYAHANGDAPSVGKAIDTVKRRFANNPRVMAQLTRVTERLGLDAGDTPLPARVPAKPITDSVLGLSRKEAGQVDIYDRLVTLHVLDSDNRGNRLVATGGVVDKELFQAWSGLIRTYAPSHIFDVGANYGEMVLPLDLPETEILGFEPNPYIFECLTKSVATHRNRGRYRLFKQAVSHETGRATFFIDKKWSGTSSLDFKSGDASYKGKGEASFEEVDVEITTLATAFAAAGLTGAPGPKPRVFLKLDVEGHEPSVLAGGAEALRGMEFLMLLEFSRTHITQAGHDPRAFLDLLAGLGSLYRIEGSSLVALDRAAVEGGRFANLVVTNLASAGETAP